MNLFELNQFSDNTGSTGHVHLPLFVVCVRQSDRLVFCSCAFCFSSAEIFREQLWYVLYSGYLLLF